MVLWRCSPLLCFVAAFVSNSMLAVVVCLGVIVVVIVMVLAMVKVEAIGTNG